MSSNIVKYNGGVDLTANGYLNSYATLAHFAQEHLRANGWGVTQFKIIGGNNFSFVLDVNCNHNPNALKFNLEQALLGVSTAIGGSVFSRVVITSLESLSNDCAVSGGNTSNTSGNTYTVRSGDTFSRIARRYGLTIAQLQALNPQVTNINIIHVGQVLNVSGTPHVTVATNVNPNTGQIQTQTQPQLGNNNNNSTLPVDKHNWFDRTFFTGAGALTGTGIAILVVLGVVVVTQRR